jgi:hypothetical protein
MDWGMGGRVVIGTLCCLAILLVGQPALGQAPRAVVINEIMAANTRTKADPQGQYDDWIELYNTTNSPIDVGGMFLTDDLSNPALWQIPEGNSLTKIPGHGFLLIWADGDVEAGGLHAGFSLSAGGEELGLIAADGTVVDSVTFGEQVADLSYGRSPDGKESWQYMATPTPEAANKAGYSGLVADVEVRPHRGFYSTPVDVILATSTPGAEIWYTLDAESPRPQSVGWAALRYTTSVRISHTTCIRAVAVKSGWKDSSVTSHTLIFLDDVIRQPAAPTGFPSTWGTRTADYAMDQRVVNDPAYGGEIESDLLSIPSVCIVIPKEDFFGSQGIYSNPSKTGVQSERAASMEWIDPCSHSQFGVNAGLRIQGGVGRANNVKKPLRFYFKAIYGPSTLDFPLFKDAGACTFNTVVLRSIWNYSWTGDSTACGGLGSSHADYLRDCFGRDTIRDMEGLVPRGRPVNVYINGLYWGLYIMAESPDDAFVADVLGGEREDYDVLKAPDGGTTMKVLTGDKKTTPPEWNTLFALADAGLASAEAYQAIQQYVDVPALIDYMLMVYYTGSRDAPTYLCHDGSPLPRNFYAIRRKNPPGPWIFIAWDVEWALENPSENRVPVVGVWNPHTLMSRLAANSEFRVLLADRIHRRFHNDGALTVDRATDRYLARAAEIDGAIVGESARWGDVKRSTPYTRSDWQAEVNRLVTQYFSGRTETVLGQLRTQGWYPSADAPVFRIDGKDQYGGEVRAGASLTLVNPKSNGTIYCSLDGSDPRAVGGQVKTSALRYTAALTLRASVQVKARVLSGTTWSALSEAVFSVGPIADGLRITEIMYHPADAGAGVAVDPNREFIELTNVASQPINLARVRFNRGVDFTFPSLDLAAGQTTVVVADKAAFQAVYGKTISVAGVYTGSLANSGERLALLDPIGRPLADFRYRDDWCSQTDGGGYSLVVRDPKADPEGLCEASHWRPSAALGGSPGRQETSSSIATPGPLVISEIMYHPLDHPDAEYVELVNVSSKAVVLYDAATRRAWRFTDGGGAGLQYTFAASSSVSVQAGQAVLLVKNLAAFRAAFTAPQGVAVFQWTSGSLDNAGDDLQLYCPVSSSTYSLVDEVRYSDGSHGGDFAEGLDPWPVSADGSGLGLDRITLTGPGNDPRNWRAGEPSPGLP